jgi:hypothetical protein
MMDTDLLIRRDPRSCRISIGGVIDASIAAAFGQAVGRDVPVMAAGSNPIELDFDDLELDDGSAVDEAINALRELLRKGPLVVRSAPQRLAATLSKTDLLQGGRLRLEAPRGQTH